MRPTMSRESDDPELDELVEKLLQQCRELGRPVSLAGTVDVETAAALVERSPATLANMRSMRTGPEFRRRGRIEYALHDLASYLLARPERR
jgi:hypothetical protein